MRKLLFFFVVVWLAACSSIDCPVQNIVSVQYTVCDHNGKEYQLENYLTIYSERKDGSDTTLLNLVTGISDFSLPISYSHPEDILVFVFAESNFTVMGSDTVWIKKQDIPHFESVDCNAAFFHEITDVRHTRHFIDSLVLLNRSVTYDQSTVHFRLVPKSND